MTKRRNGSGLLSAIDLMQISLKHFAESSGVFIRTSGKYLLFTSLFYGLWLVRAALLHQDFDLHRFPGRMIGIATLEAYDVGLRVSLYYKCILLLLFSFLGFNFSGYLIHKRKPELFSGSEIKLLNASSLAGIVFMLFQLCNFKCEETLELVYFTHKLVIVSILLKLIIFKKNQLSIYSYVLAIVLSVSLYFFISDVMSLSGAYKNPDFLITTFILCCLSLIALNRVSNEDADREHYRLRLTAYMFVPLTFLPFISILKDELFLVCKTNAIALNGQWSTYATLLIILFTWIFIRYRRSKKQALPTLKENISRSYFPILVFSLVSYILYSPFINYSNEVFEAGNKYLAVMEFKLFGVIPTLEKFNSHLVSDYFFSAVYTFFNGLQGREMELYDFLYTSISFALFYYLVYFITRNPFIAIFSVLLFPLSGSLLPEHYSFSVLCIFAFHKLISGTQTLKKYLLFFTTITTVVLWRIDLGYSCVVAIVLITLYYHFFSGRFTIYWGYLLKSLGIIFSAILIIFISLSLYRHQNLFTKLTYALNYLNSAQTYGYSLVSPEKNLIYKMHYFVFPALVTLVLLGLLIKHKNLNTSRGQRLAYLSLLFTAAFYLVNFNRGLIRHSLVEGVDHFTTSLAYIVFAGSVFVFSKRGTQYYKFIAFCGVAFFTLVTYKLPDPKNSSGYFEVLLKKLNNPEKINLAEINDRVKTRAKEDGNRDFLDFIAKNTTSEETFIDFCNSPMLFYYTKKITPSYFLQNPACSHNDFLQNVFIEDLKDYKTPYLTFRRNDDMSRDKLDEVDNTFRHYRIAEYLFQHYTPYVDIDNLDVWRRNDVKNKNTIREMYSFKKTVSDTLIQFEFNSKAGKKYFAKLLVEGKVVDLNATNTNIHFHGPEYVNDTLAYCSIETGDSGSRIHLTNANIRSFQLMECDYIPDVSFEKYFSYELQKLPYIWGTYDEKLDKEQILFETNTSVSLNPSGTYSIEIPEQLNRTSGNTLIIHCKNTSTQIQNLVVSFGDKEDAGRSKVSFEVLPSKKEECYAIRVSSVYKWYTDKINVIEILPAGGGVTVSKVQLTKGT